MMSDNTEYFDDVFVKKCCNKIKPKSKNPENSGNTINLTIDISTITAPFNITINPTNAPLPPLDTLNDVIVTYDPLTKQTSTQIVYYVPSGGVGASGFGLTLINQSTDPNNNTFVVFQAQPTQ